MYNTNLGVVYADWCTPCKDNAPVFEKLSGDLSNKDSVTFVKVNTETQPQLAEQHNLNL